MYKSGMTDDMIERVARLLAEQREDFRLSGPSAGFPQTQVVSAMAEHRVPNFQNHIADARTIIAAMREPTEEMMKAKAKDDIGGDAPVDGYLDYLSADDVWRAMIDAALADGRAL